MSKKSTLLKSPPAAVKEILKQLGRNIRIARLRRDMRLVDLAERVGVSRFLIADIEKGKPTVSMAAYMTTLWALGLADDELRHIADPSRDTEGRALESARLPKTAAKRKKTIDNDF